MAGIDIVHVPYKEARAGAHRSARGQVQMMFDSPITSLPLVRSGKLRVGDIQCHALARGARNSNHYRCGRARVRGSALVRLARAHWRRQLDCEPINRDVVAIIGQREVRARIVELGADPVGNQVEQFKSEIERDARKWATIVRKSGATVQ
ncbi:MAG: hypothetical protein IPO58_24485 [Betaproteobacteria bacterium]|nr:hypothetical protein [Betaproteobacteria bacterium]